MNLKLAERLMGKFKCSACGHSLKGHDKDRPEWANVKDQRAISAAVMTFNPMGFNYCAVTYCSECERAAVHRTAMPASVFEVGRKEER